MIQPSALNFVVIALNVIILAFLWRMASAALLKQNKDSGLAKGMAAIFS